MNIQKIETIESNVRSYSRSYPAEFSSAYKSYITDRSNNTYLDFLSGCGSLNYGHNDYDCRDALVNYLSQNGIAMSMDLFTQAKREFIQAFCRNILQPRQLDYRLHFTGPTGANAVEAAIKLARKYTGRTNIIAFTNAFHGCSLGALSLTANAYHRDSSKGLLTNVTRMPYDGYFGKNIDTSAMIAQLLDDPSAGIEKPAAFIFETIQGEGGLNTASEKWIHNIVSMAKNHNILIIVDDIQAGCGRSGKFFSFEEFNIKPDIVILAKSISGFGLPMSLILLNPDIDVWEPAEHNGTFRGNNHAFVTATVALNKFWSNNVFENELQQKILYLSQQLDLVSKEYNVKIKGRGFMQGIELANTAIANDVKSLCYQHRLIIETSGNYNQVLKLLPPLTIEYDDLAKGLEIIKNSLADLI